jgi:hypothetical protein
VGSRHTGDGPDCTGAGNVDDDGHDDGHAEWQHDHGAWHARNRNGHDDAACASAATATAAAAAGTLADADHADDAGTAAAGTIADDATEHAGSGAEPDADADADAGTDDAVALRNLLHREYGARDDRSAATRDRRVLRSRR